MTFARIEQHEWATSSFLLFESILIYLIEIPSGEKERQVTRILFDWHTVKLWSIENEEVASKWLNWILSRHVGLWTCDSYWWKVSMWSWSRGSPQVHSPLSSYGGSTFHEEVETRLVRSKWESDMFYTVGLNTIMSPFFPILNWTLHVPAKAENLQFK